jgi:methionine aminopeptidase
LTYNLSKSKKIDSILNSYQELFLQVEKIKIGDCINIIGKLVNKLLLKRHNLNLISCLSGHAIQMNLLHSDPIIPNYYFKTKNTFTQNLLFTIEPYISLGYTKISLGPCNIFRKNNQFMCERWNNIKSPQESYPVILSTNQEVLHVEHTFYLTKSGCYRLT